VSATGLLSPSQQFFDSDGNPLSGGLIYTYLAGTSTPSPTYSDSDLSIPNEIPLELDSAGRGVMYVDPSVSLKVIIKDSLGNTLDTQDNVSPAAVAS
jgi:hypothetical protein